MKTCTKCGEAKELEEFGSWGNSRPGKLKAQCKLCLNSSKREWHAQNKDAAHASNKAWLAANHKRRSEKTRPYLRAYRAQHGERLKAMGRAYYQENKSSPEYIRTRQAWSARNWRAIQARSQSYYEKNSEAIRKRTRSWAVRHPAKCQGYSSARRAAEEQARLVKTTPELTRVFSKCRELTAATGVPHEVDHIYPLRGHLVCGLHVPSNLRVVTAKLNSRKGSKLPGHLAHELWDPNGPGVFHG